MSEEQEKENRNKVINIDIKDRLLLSQILPVTGRYEYLIHTRAIKEMLEFSSEEVEKFKVTTEFDDQGNGALRWDTTLTEKFDIELTEAQALHMKKEFQRLSQANELHVDYLHLYEMFQE